MSFVDLATLALHRRNEMEERIKGFVDKCDHAINDINKLKDVAQSFVQRLNCEPTELKQKFLNCMKQLDEFTYLITDFNLCVSKLELDNSTKTSPDHESSYKAMVQSIPFNLMDALCEPKPSTSTTCANQCQMNYSNPGGKSINVQELITFSNNCLSDSVSKDPKETLQASPSFKDGNNPNNAGTSVHAAEVCNLPAQTLLQTDQEYPAIILNVDGLSFWVITENPNRVSDLIIEMSDYYARCSTMLSEEEVAKLTYCACYDYEIDCYYRALFIRLSEEDTKTAEVFLIDIGEVQIKDIKNIKPLMHRFFQDPPFARCCHLAGIDPISHNEKHLEEFLKQYVGTACTIEVDDNTSESLGVYVVLNPSRTNLNKMLIDQGLANAIERLNLEGDAENVTNRHGLPELTESQLNINDSPEHDDPVVAVTGYHNRDEADICKHYKGGPDRTCFKGARCTKKHVMKHPDGWTLDRVPVMGKCPPRTLPPPGARLRVHVTHVAHYDRVFVQLVTEQTAEKLPAFGVTLPPTTLNALVADMNGPATRLTYKPLKMTPAPGELVAALYPLDEQWYRARVLSTSRLDQSIEVMYIDYGNVVWVKEESVRELEPRHCALEVQAMCCSLAGVRARNSCSRQWAMARALLQRLTTDRILHACVVACDYDEITVELFDENNASITEQLAASKLVELVDYTQEVDNGIRQRIIAP